jgi:predicted DNA-binding transcriptional regulator AlpA
MVNDDRGALLKFRAICDLCGSGESTMRALIRANRGPPVFRRPGGGRYLAYENEVRAWLASARVPPAAARMKRRSK